MSDDQSERKNVDPFKNLIAGGVGGACLVIIGHPPDTIKVRLQTMPQQKKGEKAMYEGTIDCVKQSVKKEVCFFYYILDSEQFLSSRVFYHYIEVWDLCS